MFFISVFGVTAPDEYVILKVTQDTSVYDGIAQVIRTINCFIYQQIQHMRSHWWNFACIFICYFYKRITIKQSKTADCIEIIITYLNVRSYQLNTVYMRVDLRKGTLRLSSNYYIKDI